MKFVGTCFRAHDPKWSFNPLSGDGAKLYGGRFNVKGTAALYLSLSPIIAIKEANQGFANKIHPLTLCSYEVDCEDIADLRDDAGRVKHGASLPDMSCAWFDLALTGNDPPSWRLARRLIKKGFSGILVPSFVNNAAADDYNLVLWRWGKDLPHKVEVFDPTNRLPKNQISWP